MRKHLNSKIPKCLKKAHISFGGFYMRFVGRKLLVVITKPKTESVAHFATDNRVTNIP